MVPYWEVSVPSRCEERRSPNRRWTCIDNGTQRSERLSRQYRHVSNVEGGGCRASHPLGKAGECSVRLTDHQMGWATPAYHFDLGTRARVKAVVNRPQFTVICSSMSPVRPASGRAFSRARSSNAPVAAGFTARYVRMPRLLHELAVGRGDGSYARFLTRLAKLDLLAIDDWMIAPLRDAERRDLTEVIEDRAESGSTLIVSQLPVTDWHAVIGDANQADAICDRPAPRRTPHRAEGPLEAADPPRPEDPHDGGDVNIPTPVPAPRPNPASRTTSRAGAGRPMDRTGGMGNAHDALAADCTVSQRVSHTALDGTERRPYAPQARSLYSSNKMSRRTSLRSRTSVPLRRNPCSRSPESLFHFTEMRTWWRWWRWRRCCWRCVSPRREVVRVVEQVSRSVRLLGRGDRLGGGRAAPPTIPASDLPSGSGDPALVLGVGGAAGSVLVRDTGLIRDDGGFVVGSHAALVDAVVSHRTVSRRHARVTRDRGRFYIKDLNSGNGTRVNGEALEPFQAAGDRAGATLCNWAACRCSRCSRSARERTRGKTNEETKPRDQHLQYVGPGGADCRPQGRGGAVEQTPDGPDAEFRHGGRGLRRPALRAPGHYVRPAGNQRFAGGMNPDAPEAFLLALREAGGMSWRSEAEQRVIVLITDNPAYPEEVEQAVLEAASFAAAGDGRVVHGAGEQRSGRDLDRVVPRSGGLGRPRPVGAGHQWVHHREPAAVADVGVGDW